MPVEFKAIKPRMVKGVEKVKATLLKSQGLDGMG